MKKIVSMVLLLVSALVMPAAVLAETIPAPAAKKIEYLLPYPGALPDSPLYMLKTLRDRILDVLIVDPIRKAEFYLLQADKRLNMGIFLVAQNKQVLAEQTISKGEKYMLQTVHGLVAVKTGGKDVPAYLVERVETSLAKHVEELEILIAKTNDPVKTGLSGSLEMVQRLQGDVKKLK